MNVPSSSKIYRVVELLEEHHGHRRNVVEILKVIERTLYRKLMRYNLVDVGKST